MVEISLEMTGDVYLCVFGDFVEGEGKVQKVWKGILTKRTK